MRVALLLLAISVISTADVFSYAIQKPPFNHAKYMNSRRLAMFAEDLPKSGSPCNPCKKKTIRETVVSHYDASYTIEVSMGTPPQNFSLILDTASTPLWLFSGEYCGSPACTGQGIQRSLFQSSDSTSFQKTWTEFRMKYETGSVKGYYASDVLSIGPIELDSQEFGLVYSADDAFRSRQMDGILGLAPTAQAEAGRLPFLAHVSSMLDEQIFTIALERQSTPLASSDAGVITFGGLDNQRCKKDVIFSSLKDSMFWEIDVQSFTIGSFKSSDRRSAISDSGYSTIGLPSDAFFALVSTMNATLDKTSNMYSVQCNGEFPPLTFEIGGHSYEIQPMQILLHFPFQPDNDCYMAATEVQGYAYGASYILGQPFHRTVCTVYDFGQKRIGFSETIHSDG